MTENREIHFYTDLSNENQVSEWDLEDMLTDFVSTNKAINVDKDKIIKTTQLSFLYHAPEYLKNNFKLFVHFNNLSVTEITENNKYTVYSNFIKNGRF